MKTILKFGVAIVKKGLPQPVKPEDLITSVDPSKVEGTIIVDNETLEGESIVSFVIKTDE